MGGSRGNGFTRVQYRDFIGEKKVLMVNDGEDRKEEVRKILWRKGKRKTRLAHTVGGGTGKGSSSGFESRGWT